MQIDPFHVPCSCGAAEHLWHDNDQCLLALALVASGRQPGTGEGSHCPYCVLLNQPARPCQPRPPQLILVQAGRLRCRASIR